MASIIEIFLSTAESESNFTSSNEFLNILIGVGIGIGFVKMTDTNKKSKILFHIASELNKLEGITYDFVQRLNQLCFTVDNYYRDIFDVLCDLNHEHDARSGLQENGTCVQCMMVLLDRYYIDTFDKQWINKIYQKSQLQLRLVKKMDTESYASLNQTINYKTICVDVIQKNGNSIVLRENIHPATCSKGHNQYVIFQENYMTHQIIQVPVISYGYVNTGAETCPDFSDYVLVRVLKEVNGLFDVIYDLRIAHAWNLSPEGDLVKRTESDWRRIVGKNDAESLKKCN